MNIPPPLRLIYGGSIDLQSYYTNIIMSIIEQT